MNAWVTDALLVLVTTYMLDSFISNGVVICAAFSMVVAPPVSVDRYALAPEVELVPPDNHNAECIMGVGVAPVGVARGVGVIVGVDVGVLVMVGVLVGVAVCPITGETANKISMSR